MACSASWITKGSTKSIQNTNIELKGVHENCTLAICNIRFPWGQDLYLRSFNKNGSETYYNPSNSSEYVIVKCVDTWCTTTGNAAEFEVCHEKPLESGKIRCITTPPEADIYFDGRKQVNTTPVILTEVIPNKVHIIEFKKSGFEDTSDEWSVKPGQTIVAERILTPIMQPGYIYAISDLPDVTVKMIIEGKTYSYPAPHKFGAPAGRQVVFFSKPDHKQVEHSVTVEPRQTVTLKGNPIPIVADTTLILNTLPSEVSEGDKITLTGTLQSKDGKPVVGQIHFYDKDTATADDELFENNKPLVAMSSSSTGKYSATWTAKKVDSESLIKRGTSGAQIYAAFDGTQTHNKSKSMIRNITLKEIVKEGQLRITTRPPGADVYIDGEKQPIGTSAEEFSVIKKLPFGKYIVKTEIKGFDPMEEEVEIKEGPYETIVNHIYEGAKNLCGVLGLETTGLGCVRAILTIPVDLFTPLADAYVINYHKSLYTGKPEEPTNLTYAFFILACLPVGPITKLFKGAVKFSKTGAKLANIAKADTNAAKVFTDENIVGKILAMSGDKLDDFIGALTGKNYDGASKMLSDLDVPDVPDAVIADAHKSIRYLIKKPDDQNRAIEMLNSALKPSRHVSYGNPEFWETFFVKRYLHGEELVSGGLGQFMADMCIEVVNLGKVFPITKTKLFIDRLIDIGEYDELVTALSKSSKLNANILAEYFGIFRKIVDGQKNFPDQSAYEAMLKRLGSLSHDAMLTHDTTAMPKIAKALLDVGGNLKPLDDIAKSDLFKDIIKITPTDLLTRFSDMFVSLAAGTKTKVSVDEANDFLQMATDSPDVAKNVLKVRPTNIVIEHLDDIKTAEATSISTYIKSIEKIDTRFSTDEFEKISSKVAETSKSILKTAPDQLDEIVEGSEDIMRSGSNALTLDREIINAKLKWDYNIIEEIEIFYDAIKKTPLLSRPKATISFIKNLSKAQWSFLKAHKTFAMALFITTAAGATGMTIWYCGDNIPFYITMITRALGLSPQARSFNVKARMESLTSLYFRCDFSCKNKNYDDLKERLNTYLEELTALEEYAEKNKDVLEREQTLEDTMFAIEGFRMTYDDLLTCLPGEIIVPEAGLIPNVTVKKIIDGDTIECWKDETTFNVRMAGYNTPEKKPTIIDFYPVTCTESVGSEPHTIECSKEMYQKANGFFWKLIESKTVTLKIDPDRPKDNYERYIAVVILEDNSEANFEMIKAGHACFYHEEYFGKPEIYDPDTYIAARNEAKKAGLGIWAPFELDVDIGYADFTTIPTGAQIYINNEYFTTTKKSNASFEVGTYAVRFVKEGFHPCEQEFEIKKDEKTPVTCTLKKITEEEKKLGGYALFRAFRKSSSGDLVSISADVWDETSFLFRTSPSTSRALQPGDYNITFKRYNYEDKSTSFTIETDKTITVDETLIELPKDEIDDPDEPDEPFGLVDFMSTPSVAKIFVNGSYIGTTKKSGFKLAEGSYSVMFEKEGYETCTKQLLVIVDERVPVECILTESLLPPTEGEYPDVPYFPTSPSRTRLPPSTHEVAPISAQPAEREPEAEPWEEFKVPMKVLFLNIGKEVTKQSIIATAGQKFIDKHCDLEFEWESEDHDVVELGIDDNDCATLDDIEELTEVIEPDKIPDSTKIIYLLWNADEPKCVSYTGFTSGMDDLLFDAILCSSPTSKSKPEFTATTGKLKNDNLDIKYEGSLTTIIQICEALHELYEKTKSDDAEELPEFDDELCKKDITDDRPNAKCVVEWLSKFNDALPDEVKK